MQSNAGMQMLACKRWHANAGMQMVQSIPAMQMMACRWYEIRALVTMHIIILISQQPANARLHNAFVPALDDLPIAVVAVQVETQSISHLLLI